MNTPADTTLTRNAYLKPLTASSHQYAVGDIVKGPSGLYVIDGLRGPMLATILKDWDQKALKCVNYRVGSTGNDTHPKLKGGPGYDVYCIRDGKKFGPIRLVREAIISGRA